MSCRVDEVAVVDADGEMEILRLSDGKAVATYRWKAHGFPRVERMARRPAVTFVSWRSRNKHRERARIRGPTAVVRRRPQGFSGQLIALDRASGRSLWKRPAEIHQFFLPDVPTERSAAVAMYRLIHDIPKQEDESDRGRPQDATRTHLH